MTQKVKYFNGMIDIDLNKLEDLHHILSMAQDETPSLGPYTQELGKVVQYFKDQFDKKAQDHKHN